MSLVRRHPQPDWRRNGSRRLGDDVTGEGRTRPGREREIEVAVVHIDHPVDELAPLQSRVRGVRLDNQSVPAGRHARDLESALCAHDCHNRSASEATEAAKQPDVEAFGRLARRAGDRARHAHGCDRHEFDVDRHGLTVERADEHRLRNIERRRIERGSIQACRNRAAVRECRDGLCDDHVGACSKTGDSKRSGLVRGRGSGASAQTLRAIRSLSDVLGRKRLNLCPSHRHVMFIKYGADDDDGAVRFLVEEAGKGIGAALFETDVGLHLRHGRRGGQQQEQTEGQLFRHDSLLLICRHGPDRKVPVVTLSDRQERDYWQARVMPRPPAAPQCAPVRYARGASPCSRERARPSARAGATPALQPSARSPDPGRSGRRG